MKDYTTEKRYPDARDIKKKAHKKVRESCWPSLEKQNKEEKKDDKLW